LLTFTIALENAWKAPGELHFTPELTTLSHFWPHNRPI
jgi:hypothetical protein